jgi:pimeloyl-ACP methyl ester carboxylesterase
MIASDGYVTTADGIRLYCRMAGQGSEAVLIPNGLYLVDDFAPLADTRTVVFYDLRNRGRSDAVTDPATLARGIEADVDDIDAVRAHVGADRIALVGHSYVATTIALYAMRHPDRVSRLVQIGPVSPDPHAEYPPELTNADDTLRRVLARLRDLEPERASTDPAAFCRRAWTILRELYVVDPADAHRVAWDRCDLPNERAFMRYWIGHVLPSIARQHFTRDALARVTMPALVVHGRLDRSSPYGAGRDWAGRLPNARLLTIDRAAHAPWVEAPGLVRDRLEPFLAGAWPADAELVNPAAG